MVYCCNLIKTHLEAVYLISDRVFILDMYLYYLINKIAYMALYGLIEHLIVLLRINPGKPMDEPVENIIQQEHLFLLLILLYLQIVPFH